MDKTKAEQALKVFQELARASESATDLHNAFFGVGGRFGELFPTRAEREKFAATPEYAEIVRIRSRMRQQETAAR